MIREWEYWGFSDGLEAPGAHGGEDGAIEIFLRTAFLLPNKPAVLFLNMEPNGEGRKTKQIRQALTGKLKPYGERFGVGVLCAFGKPFDHFESSSTKIKKTSIGLQELPRQWRGRLPRGRKARRTPHATARARCARGLSVKAVGRSREIVYKLAPRNIRTRDDGPPGRFCCAESGAIRPRGFGSGERASVHWIFARAYCLRQVALL